MDQSTDQETNKKKKILYYLYSDGWLYETQS